jgi:prevent-host-death family protein
MKFYSTRVSSAGPTAFGEIRGPFLFAAESSHAVNQPLSHNVSPNNAVPRSGIACTQLIAPNMDSTLPLQMSARRGAACHAQGADHLTSCQVNDIIMIHTLVEDAMPLIKPISDLRNKAKKISDLAHKSGEPIFITRNGEGDMVVMSMARYTRLQLQIDLFSKLAVAQAQRAQGDKGRTLSQVMKDLRKRIRESA